MKNLLKLLSLLLLVSCSGDYGEGSYVLDEEIHRRTVFTNTPERIFLGGKCS
jgi:hypothetical protein